MNLLEADSLYQDSTARVRHLDISEALDTCNGFFQGNPLIRHGDAYPSWGISADLLTPQPWQTHWLAASLLALGILTLVFLGWYWRGMRLQARNFVFSFPSGQEPSHCILPWHAILCACAILSLTGGFFCLAWFQTHNDLFFVRIPPYLLTLAFSATIALYFMLYFALSGFVNSIFFEQRERNLWRDAETFILLMEAYAFCLLTHLAVFLPLDVKQMQWAVPGVLLGGLFLYTYKLQRIFFPRYYLIFHLFAYLCTLKILPLLALAWTLTEITKHLTS